MDESKFVIARVTPEEKEKLKALAKEKGVPLSVFLKLRAFSESARFEDTMTVKEAAAYLQVSPTTLVKMCQSAKIKAAVIEGRYVFKKSDVEEYLESRTRSMDISYKAKVAGLDRLLTSQEAANYCKVTDETIRNWVRHDRLPCLWAGKQMRFRTSDIEAFLENTTVRTRKKRR